VAAGLDSRYQDGALDVTVQIARLLPCSGSSATAASYQIEAFLYDDDADGPLVAKATVARSSSSSIEEEEVVLSIPVKAPRKWTAETPELYTLVLVLRAVGDDGEGVEQVQAESCRLGFR
jgi:beta-galactosidase